MKIRYCKTNVIAWLGCWQVQERVHDCLISVPHRVQACVVASQGLLWRRINATELELNIYT